MTFKFNLARPLELWTMVMWSFSLGTLTACGSNEDGPSPNDGGKAGPSCAAAVQQVLEPIDSISSGEVTVLSRSGGLTTLFIDASAGGTTQASTNPRIYLNLETASKVDVTDKSAAESTEWDLALKRPIIFTNGGDGGRGHGGAILIPEDITAVTASQASSSTFALESFFDADCSAKVDATGAVRTTFDGGYDYDAATNGLTPQPGTWLVKGGTGKVYKLRIVSYYATQDGGVGQAGGRYLLELGAL